MAQGRYLGLKKMFENQLKNMHTKATGVRIERKILENTPPSASMTDIAPSPVLSKASTTSCLPAYS